MDIFSQTKEVIVAAVNKAVADGKLPDSIYSGNIAAITAEPPKDPSHGDIATNAAMVLAKAASMKPKDIAEAILPYIENWQYTASISIAGPGFINISLKDEYLHILVSAILNQGSSYGNSEIGKGQNINIEYVSANPTGPMHIGHVRGAIVGDSIANLLIKTGHEVTREFYINDAGSQIEILAHSVYLRYLEAMGEDIGEIPEGLYPGEYLKPIGEILKTEFGSTIMNVPDNEWLPKIKNFALNAMLEMVKLDLEELGVVHDVFTSEAEVTKDGAVDAAIGLLEQKNMVYTGVLEPPKGKLPDDWEEREQLLFKSSEFGDDLDRPLKKSDGKNTYFAADIAYLQDKLQRGFNSLILSLGADHGGYVKRMKAATKILSDDKVEIDIILHQLVNLMDDGQPIKMSKRAGNFVTAQQVIDAVGKDVIRFMMLTRKSEATLDFDLKKVKEQSRDNPVFYVQYAHARIHSVLRQIYERMPELKKYEIVDTEEKIIALLKDKNEMALIKQISQWPRIVESASIRHEPHRIAFYLQDLAAELHGLWNLGNDRPELRFIIDESPDLTRARMAMIKACAITISSGLAVMGVDPVYEM